MKIDLEGVCDMHIHTSPDIGDRIGDDFEVTRICRDAGMRAIVLKSDFESTASRAILTRKIVPGIEIFSSICLNTPVGGVNPAAVEIALKLGAKVIWLPTKYSKAHINIKGVPKLKTTVVGETVFDDIGELTQSCRQIVSLAKEYDVVIGTGHLSKEEILAVVKYSREVNYEKIVITHPHFVVPRLNDKELKELVDMGAWVEFCAGTVFPNGPARIEQVISALNTVGPNKCIVTSDAGRPTKPLPTDTLSVYLYCLSSKGIKKEWIDLLVRENPAVLLKI
jgi:predicted metal-dependent TIM-barrel fold hydrolase